MTKKNFKAKPKRLPGVGSNRIVSQRSKKYTHLDSNGMAWRFEGSRPISEIADKVMRECGL